MAKIQENQENIVEWMHEHPDEAHKVNPNVFVVMDDCISQDLHHAEQLKEVFFNGTSSLFFLRSSTNTLYRTPPENAIAYQPSICQRYSAGLSRKLW